MSEPWALVEHFFRHEFGRLVALLTRSHGVCRRGIGPMEASPPLSNARPGKKAQSKVGSEQALRISRHSDRD
jgi:hypothetical protein